MSDDPKVKAAVNRHALEMADHLTKIVEIIQGEIQACMEQDVHMTEALYRKCSQLLKDIADIMDSFRKSMGH